MKNNDIILERNPEQELLEYKEDSEWSCCLFGSKPNDGIFWRPKKIMNQIGFGVGCNIFVSVING